MISALAGSEAVISTRSEGSLSSEDRNIVPSNASAMAKDQMLQCGNRPPTYFDYPPRLRTLVSPSSTEKNLDDGGLAADKRKPLPAVRQHNSNMQSHRQDATCSYSGAPLGVWRDSKVPDDARKHSVVGWLDVRDRLRTRILPMTIEGESLAESYPLSSGSGSIWVKFDNIIFSDHLVGLNQFEIKEYTRIRSTTDMESYQQLRTASAKAAVDEAVRRVKASGLPRNDLPPPSIAKGPNSVHRQVLPTLPDSKRRKLTDRFVSICPAVASGISDQAALPRTAPSKTSTSGITTEQQPSLLLPTNANTSDSQTSFRDLQSSTAGSHIISPSILRASESDCRVYDNTKYIRQNKGPFSGKLVSKGTIIVIDAEDYVEYRVLTKPLFF